MTTGLPLAPAIGNGNTVLMPFESFDMLQPALNPLYAFRYVPPRRLMTSPAPKVWRVNALNRFCQGSLSVPVPAVDAQFVEIGAT